MVSSHCGCSAAVATAILLGPTFFSSLGAEAPWLPLSSLAPKPPPPAEGTVYLTSQNQLLLTQRIIQSAASYGGRVVLSIDVTWKICTQGALSQQRLDVYIVYKTKRFLCPYTQFAYFLTYIYSYLIAYIIYIDIAMYRISTHGKLFVDVCLGFILGWGLLTFGIGNKHLDKRGVPVTETVPIGFSWVPKENWASFTAALVTCLSVCEQHGVSLRDKLLAVMLDGSRGAEKAIATVLPRVPVLRDLRHILVNCKKIPAKCKGPENGAGVGLALAHEVSWTAYLPTDILFHEVWSQVLANNAFRNLHELNAYIQEELLCWKDAVLASGPFLVQGTLLTLFYNRVTQKSYHERGVSHSEFHQ